MSHVLLVQLGRAGLAEERIAEGVRIPAAEINNRLCCKGVSGLAAKLLKFGRGKRVMKLHLGDAVTAIGSWNIA